MLEHRDYFISLFSLLPHLRKLKRRSLRVLYFCVTFNSRNKNAALGITLKPVTVYAIARCRSLYIAFCFAGSCKVAGISNVSKCSGEARNG